MDDENAKPNELPRSTKVLLNWMNLIVFIIYVVGMTILMCMR